MYDAVILADYVTTMMTMSGLLFLTAVTTCYGQKLVTNMAATEKICNPSQPQKKHFCTQK